MKYLLYCDVSTLKNCSIENFEKVLCEKANTWMKVSEHLWLIDLGKPYPVHIGERAFISSFENFFNEVFDPITTDDSFVFIIPLEKDYWYNLPTLAHNFLNSGDD